MSSPLFSIILPCFNAEKYIDAAIASVLRQSFQDFELIIIDDGSTDKSWDLINKASLSAPRIKKMHIENAGVSNARNLGLEVSKGQYVTFIDADDIMENNALADYHSIVSEHDVDLVIGSTFQFSSSIKTKTHRRRIEGPTLYTGEDILKLSKQFLRGDFDHANWNKLYLKSKLYNLRFDSRLITGEDMMFNWHYWNHVSRVYLMDSPVMNYRRHPESAWRNPLNRFEKFRMLIVVFEENKEKIRPQFRQICAAYLNEIYWYYKLPELLQSKEVRFFDKAKYLLLATSTTTIQQSALVGSLKIKILQVILKTTSKLIVRLVKKG